VGPRAVLEAVVNKKFPAPAGNRTLEPRSSSPYLSAIPRGDNIKMDLKGIGCEEWTGFIWLRIGTSDRLLQTR